MRLAVVITARASYARIKTVLEQLQGRQIDTRIILAASALVDKYGDLAQVVEDDGFAVSRRVPCLIEGNDPGCMVRTVGLLAQQLAGVLEDLRPDAVLTIADRYETLATAMAGSYTNVPVIHVQGGEVTGSIDDRVRNAVTCLSDVHFVATQNAAQRVIGLGADPVAVWAVGCPSVDLAARECGPLNFDPFSFGGVGPKFNESAYLVVLQHPDTTGYARAATEMAETLEGVLASGLPAFCFWPNADAGSLESAAELRRWREANPEAPVHFFRNLPPERFLRLVFNSIALVGNSSCGIRECSYMGVPAVNVGSRQAGRERGPNVIDVSPRHAMVAEAIEAARKRPRERCYLYGDGHAGEEIAEILEQW